MMTEVIEIRGKKSFAGPGAYGYDAEAKVVDNGQELYVSINVYDDFRHYTVSKESVFEAMSGTIEETEDEPLFAGDPDFLEKADKYLEEHKDIKGPEYIEYYESAGDAKASKYWKAFETLQKVVLRLMDGVR